jgi:pilus assembly protein CpaE
MADREISALVAHDAGVSGSWLSTHIPRGSGVSVVDTVAGLNPIPDEVQDSDADVLVVACAEQSDEALSLVEWWAVHRPKRPVVVLSHASRNGLLRRAFSAGADDLIVIDPESQFSSETSGELIFALQKAVARRSGVSENGNGNGPGTMICVLGPKGGIGKTLTSCNLGLALTESGKRVVLVDLDLQFGDLALSLGLTPGVTVHDLATAGGSLDAGKVESYLATHPSGMRVLMAPTRPDQAAGIGIDFLRDTYHVLRAAFDYVIVDTPPGFTPEVIASIDASSSVCMVGMLDALSLKNTKLGLETLELMGYRTDRVRLVLNRADSSVGITHNDVLSILGRPPDVLVPSHRDITRSVNEGTPVVLAHKRSEAAKAFQALAALYTSDATPAEQKPPKRSLLGRSRA